MIHRTRNTGLTVASALSLSVVVASAQAQSFVIGSGETAGQQVLSDPAGTGIVKSNGKVSTAIDQEAGVLMLNDNQSVEIESGGTVETEGNESDGITSEGSNASIVSDGSIITTGDQLAGIFSLGPGASIRNSGTISSLGQNAPYGISATGVGAVVENAGLIETGGPQYRSHPHPRDRRLWHPVRWRQDGDREQGAHHKQRPTVLRRPFCGRECDDNEFRAN
jgi:hypothetical protein